MARVALHSSSQRWEVIHSETPSDFPRLRISRPVLGNDLSHPGSFMPIKIFAGGDVRSPWVAMTFPSCPQSPSPSSHLRAQLPFPSAEGGGGWRRGPSCPGALHPQEGPGQGHQAMRPGPGTGCLRCGQGGSSRCPAPAGHGTDGRVEPADIS